MLFSVPVILRTSGAGAVSIGVVQALMAAGAVGGALASSAIARRWNVGALMIAAAASSALLFSVGALLAPSTLVAIPLMLSGFLLPAANTAFLGQLARTIPDTAMGTTIALMQFVGQLAAVAAPITAGTLISLSRGGLALGVFAVSETLAAILAVVLRAARPTALERSREYGRRPGEAT